MSPEQAERSREIWCELTARIDGPLPFVRVDPNNPQVITSLWDVTSSGDQFEDAERGLMYAETGQFNKSGIRQCQGSRMRAMSVLPNISRKAKAR
jgi:hypothetical protein